MSYFISLIGALVLLGILITLHELGHYLVGRSLGLPVIEFAVGFGPRLFGFERSGIKYSMRALPLGGYCAFAGEDSPEETDRALWDGKRADSLNDCPAWRRLLMQAAGPAMNMLTAYVCAVVLLAAVGLPILENTIQNVVPGAPAQVAGIQPGDKILSIGGVQAGDVAAEIVKHAGQPVEVVVERDGQSLPLSVTPTLDSQANIVRMGVEISYSYDYQRVPVLSAFAQAGSYCIEIMQEMVELLRGLIFGGQGAEDVAGVVGTVNFMAQQTAVSFNYGARSGFLTVLSLAIVISLNLGIVNLLPLPALDGGRIIFTLVELIFRRPIPRRVEGWIHTAGFVLLMGLMAVLFFKDIATLIQGGASI